MSLTKAQSKSYGLSDNTTRQLERLIYHANGGPESLRHRWSVGCAEGVNLSVFSCACVRASLPLHPLLSLCLSQTGEQTCSFLCVASQVLPLQSYTGRRFITAACNASVSKRQYHTMWRIFIWGLSFLHWIGKVHFFNLNYFKHLILVTFISC